MFVVVLVESTPPFPMRMESRVKLWWESLWAARTGSCSVVAFALVWGCFSALGLLEVFVAELWGRVGRGFSKCCVLSMLTCPKKADPALEVCVCVLSLIHI